LVFGALWFPTGLGLLRKRRFGLILTYALCGLSGFGALFSFNERGAIGAWVVSLLSFYYYYKRRREFD